VKTSTGQTGRTYNDEEPVNGKVVVHLLQGFKPLNKKLLCDPSTLQVTGFID
jgi:hypothetical protein